MFRYIILIMTMLLLFSQSGWSQVAGVPVDAPAGPQPKSMARATFHITVDDDYGDKHALVTGLLSSKPLQRESVQTAIRNLLKEEPTELPDVTFTPPTPNGSVQVRSFDDLLPAAKVLEAFEEVLAAKLLSLDTARISWENQIAQERPRVAELAAKLANERGGLMALAVANQIELDPAVAAQKRIRLETELQSMSVEQQGLEARRTIIEHQIAELGKKANDAAGAERASHKDEIIGEMKKSIEARKIVLEVRQAQLSRGTKDGGVESVEQAKDELAKAEVELAKYRRASADAAGGQRVTDLQRRLEDTAIDLVEITAKHRAIRDLVDQSRKHSTVVEMKRIEVELLEQDYRRAREELSQLQSKLRQHISPTVTLIPLE